MKRLTLKLDASTVSKMQEVMKMTEIEDMLKKHSNQAAERIGNGFYKAPEAYWHYFNKGISKVKLEAGTIGRNIYSVRTPEKEKENEVKFKIGVKNNAETGWLGNVAVFIEYGTATMPKHPIFRKEFKASSKALKDEVKSYFNKKTKLF